MNNDAIRLIQWTGRTAAAEDGGVQMGYPGVTAVTRFKGRSLSWETNATSPDCFLNVKVDHGPSRILRVPSGFATLDLANELSDDEHTVVVVRRTESWMGQLTVTDVRTDPPGGLLPAPPLPERKLMFIGDSITCGAAVDCLPPDFLSGHINSDAEGSFGMELGRRFNAQVHLIGYGGRGLVRDYQGLGADRTLVAPVMFERSMPDDPAALWDHSRYRPDAIVVGLGQNDFTSGICEKASWCGAYDAFLGRIREVHPDALIVLTNSPMHSDQADHDSFARGAALSLYVDEVLTLRRAAGDHRVAKAVYRHQPGSAANSHPNRPQHQAMADDLEPVLRSRLGWR